MEGHSMSARRFGIVTISDTASRGEREDVSGRTIRELLAGLGEIADERIVPDDRGAIEGALREMADSGLQFIATTGGTGLGPRDVTPEATAAVIERPAPGIPEAMRARSLETTPMAMLSRATAGVRGRTLIVNLPGSPRGVRECLEVLLPVLPHAIDILAGGGH
jgi:molybdenum cofactor synthesis domain-containing protein